MIVYIMRIRIWEVRILAAALSMFPCGTIIEVNHGYFESL